MDTRVSTPTKLFNLPQYLRIPLFQRPYVWREDHQWQPMWDDVRRLAELRQSAAADATHFLGAVVMQQLSGRQMGDAEEYALIDGQQRLTTVQLLIDSAARIFDARDLTLAARRLRRLTHNPEDLGFEGRAQLKIQHSNDDADPFASVMLPGPTLDYDDLDRDHRIVQAHQFFSAEASEWLADAGDASAVAERADALASVLLTGLEFVVISLTADENSQAIFETLNARGTPLTQADLIKNFVFQRLEAEGVDTAAAYSTHWKMFDQKFWTTEVSVGRYLVPRVALFLNHWLVAQTGEEVSTQSTFIRFRQWFEYSAARSMDDIVKALHRQALQYEGWIHAAKLRDGALDAPSLFTYRTQAAGLEAVKPVLIWLYDSELSIPSDIADAALDWVESWILRRSLLRRPTADASRLVATLIRELRGVEKSKVADDTRGFLAAQDRPGTYWPSDRELRTELLSAAAYRQHSRGRLRMFLEAVEDDARGYTSETSRTGSRVPRDTMHIEHVLPQRWRTNWPVDDLKAEVERDAHIHRFGNLTLLTASLNSSVSNGPWGGEKGKQAALRKHDVLLMNRRMRDLPSWSETDIDARTIETIEALIRTWPTPANHDATPMSLAGGPETAWIEFREIVAAGLLAPGDALVGRDPSTTATVTERGRLLVNGVEHETPSGAGRAILGRTVNGWQYWRLPDGRRLSELRKNLSSQSGTA